MKKKIVAMFLFTMLITQCFVMTSLAATGQFPVTNTYSEGQFVDVKKLDWYTPYVKQVYELGLMKGSQADRFNTKGTLTVAETIAMGSRIHSIFNRGTESFTQGNPWYQSFVDYAIENKIIESAYQNYDRAVSRAEFALILCNAMPEEALTAINNIPDGSIPDVQLNQKYSKAVYQLYRAGILTGNDKSGSFSPSSTIDRISAATIVSRITNPELRKKIALPTSVTMYAKDGRTLTVKPNQVEAYKKVGWYLTYYPKASVRVLCIIPMCDSAGGVKPEIYWRNDSKKTMKYVTFTVVPYNAVGDRVSCDITGESTMNLQITGPIKPFSKEDIEFSFFMYKDMVEMVLQDSETNRYYVIHEDFPNFETRYLTPDDYQNTFQISCFEPVWYNYDVSNIKITKISVTYMDGSKETINKPSVLDDVWS